MFVEFWRQQLEKELSQSVLNLERIRMYRKWLKVALSARAAAESEFRSSDTPPPTAG